MSQLIPVPFSTLVTRMFREHETGQRIFDLPAASFVQADPTRDFAVDFHGRRVATPLGPAAGPHSQLAQNIVLAWLAGGRIIELKTVQANDRLTIPRPSIDVRTIGFNVEWSQELSLEQSLEEYVKASMLIQILAASGIVRLAPGFDRFVFDISVGYDLASLHDDRVRRFLAGMRNAGATIDRLRREIPDPWQRFAALPFDPCVASSVTLSTFHGCPSREIEAMLTFLLREIGAPTIVKLNPTLLGRHSTEHLLHDVLGYTDIHLRREAFTTDLQWNEMVDLVSRVGEMAEREGRAFGVKLTNTLVVENDGGYLPASEPTRYMSGAPLHVLAMHLVDRFRATFGSRWPISFSGGIDRVNFADAVLLGLTPVTVCTDFLKAGGYARASRYFAELSRRMTTVGAHSIGEFILRGYGLGPRALHQLALPDDLVIRALAAYEEGVDLRVAVGEDVYAHWVEEATLLNTGHYVNGLAALSRYGADHHRRPPRKVGRGLELLNCLTCDKCVPVCPNDANFTFTLTPVAIPRETVWWDNGAWNVRSDGTLAVTSPHQIGNFADACNDCGACDVACPEDGGPQQVKPRFFGSEDAWRRASPRDGFCLDVSPVSQRMRGRFGGTEYHAWFRNGIACFVGRDFAIDFAESSPASTLHGQAHGEVDLTVFHLMNALRKAVLAGPGANFVSCLS